MKARNVITGGMLWSEGTTGKVHPIGYCALYSPPKFTEEAISTQYADKYHYAQHTHANAEEARACYREYLLDQKLNLSYELGFETTCTEPHDEPRSTSKAAEIDGWRLALCDEHRTAATAERYPGPWETE